MALWRCRKWAILLSYSDHPRKLVTLNPTKPAPDATSFFPVMGCLPQAAWPERLLSEKSGRCGIAADCWAWRFTCDWSISVRHLIRSNIWGFTAGRWLYRSSIRPTARFAKIVSCGRNGQRDWCMSRVTAIISALVICIIACPSWAVNHTITPLPTKPSATKRENWSWRTRHSPACRCVSVMLLRSMQNTSRS